MSGFGVPGGLSASSGVNSRNDFGSAFTSGPFGGASAEDDIKKLLVVGGIIVLIILILQKRL